MEKQTKYLLKAPTYSFVYSGSGISYEGLTGTYEYIKKIVTNSNGEFEYHTIPWKEEASQFTEKTALFAKQIFDDITLIKVTINYEEVI